MKLPLALVFVATATGAIAAIATSCGDSTCDVHCVLVSPLPNDAGVVPDGAAATCPACADDNATCPAGCAAVG